MKNVLSCSQLLVILFFLLGNVCHSQNSPLLCGMRSDSLPASVRETLLKLPGKMAAAEQQRTSAEQMLICRLAIDIDSYTWQQFGYDSLALVEMLHETIAASSAHFEEQTSIRLVITHINLFKDPASDPYKDATGAYTYYLALLNLPPPPAPFDKRLVLFTRPSSEYAGWAPYGEKLGSAMLGSVPIVMHELGHSFGSPHTHSCDWPGGPIDYCSPLEGGPCYDGSMEIRSRPASLMSYCDQVTSIHPLCRMVMRDHAENNFHSIASAPAPVLLPKVASISKSLYLPWPASQHALSYETMYASSVDFQDAQTIETKINGVSLHKLPQADRFFLRVRCKNAHGVSSWSNPILVDLSGSNLKSPLLKKPDHQSIIAGHQRLEFSPVAGATAYEIHLTTAADEQFNGFVKDITPHTFFDFQPFFGIFRWRVRAIFGDNPGPWSEVRLFSCNPSLDNGISLPFSSVSEPIPTSFPFVYYPSRFNTVVSISVSERADMSSPLFEKTYRHSTNQFSDWMSGLPANRQLYFRVRETNTENETLPKGMLADYTFSFHTGAIVPDRRIHFLSRLNPAVFGKSPSNLAVSANHVWFRSLNNGYIQVSTNDLTYLAHHRENTNGLIGVAKAEWSVHSDRKGNISFLNDGINGSVRIIRLNGETVGPSAQVDQFIPLRAFLGFSSEGNVCWNYQQISQLRRNELDKIIFETSGNRYITEVKVEGDLIRFIHIDNDQQSSEIIVMRSDGNILKRYHSGQNNSFKGQFRQIAADSEGKVWARQDMDNGSTSIVAIKEDQYQLFETKEITGPGQRIASVFVSHSDRVYVMTTGNYTQVYRLEQDGSWKKTGPELPYQQLGEQLWVDRLENFWLSTQYGLVYVESGDPLLSVESDPVVTLNLFPNPSSDKLYIEYPKAIKYPCQLDLIDILGRKIGSYLVTQHRSEIDIQHLSPGIYLIQTETGRRKAVGRFVKK